MVTLPRRNEAWSCDSIEGVDWDVIKKKGLTKDGFTTASIHILITRALHMWCMWLMRTEKGSVHQRREKRVTCGCEPKKKESKPTKRVGDFWVERC